MPGIYRQTTETTGMYSPIKKHLYRAQHIIPSKNCASQKIIPSHHHAPLLNKTPLELFKNSQSLPQLRTYTGRPLSPPNDNSGNYLRPYTPPEKRYNANFGKPRPKSCVYDNISTEKFINFAPKIKQFPMPEFSQMYIQDSLD